MRKSEYDWNISNYLLTGRHFFASILHMYLPMDLFFSTFEFIAAILLMKKWIISIDSKTNSNTGDIRWELVLLFYMTVWCACTVTICWNSFEMKRKYEKKQRFILYTRCTVYTQSHIVHELYKTIKMYTFSMYIIIPVWIADSKHA